MGSLMTPFLTVLGHWWVIKCVTCRPPECPVDDRYGRPVIRFGIYAQSHPRVAVPGKIHRCSCIHPRPHNGCYECFSQAVQVNRPAVGVSLGNARPLQVAVEESQQPLEFSPAGQCFGLRCIPPVHRKAVWAEVLRPSTCSWHWLPQA